MKESEFINGGRTFGAPCGERMTYLRKQVEICHQFTILWGRQRGPFTPASRPLPKGFPPLCSIYIVKCYAIWQNFSLFSRFPPPWESRLPPFTLPPPVPLPPPILPGSRPPVPLRHLGPEWITLSTG